MPADTTVIIGPARSGKSAVILGHYCTALGDFSPGSALWLAPNQAAVSEAREKIAARLRRAVLLPGCHTFGDFAKQILSASDVPIRPVDRLLKRRLLRQISRSLHAAGELKYFADMAESEGFLGWLDQLIGELKRQVTRPEELARAAKSLGKRDKDRELILIYQHYQHLLEQHQCYDQEGEFREARTLLNKNVWGPFAGVQEVVVDGFTDFSRTQLEILIALAERARRLWITLPGEADGDERAELFAKPRATLAELQTLLKPLAVQMINRPPDQAWPALTHLERRIFGNPRRAVDAPDTARIEIHACEHRLGEIRRLAREIKSLLVEGDPEFGPVSAERIGVVFRSLAQHAPLVREVFAEYGIPFALGEGIPLAEAPLLVTLIKCVQLVESDWPYRLLLDLVTDNSLRRLDDGIDTSRRAAMEYAIRRLQTAVGRAAFLQSTERQFARWTAAAEEAARNNTSDETTNEEIARWRAALSGFRRLAYACDQLPAAATWQEWAGSLQALARELGLLAVADEHELIVWRQILAGLGQARRWEEWTGAEPSAVSRAELLEELLIAGQAAAQAPRASSEGCVRVLNARQARTGEFAYLFMVGLTERSFPQLSGDDRLYSAAEIRKLNDAGLRLTERRDQLSQELLLFYEVLARPTRRLSLSYPALDDKGEPLSPSPFVDEVRRACGATVIGPDPDRLELRLNPVLRDDEPIWSEREARLRAVSQALHGRAAALVRRRYATPPADRPVPSGEMLERGLRAVAGRGEAGVYGPYDGMLLSDDSRRRLAVQFGPQHCWSTSQLESYATCPFRFFGERVLNLRELPELSFGTDHAARGSWFHEAVTYLHRAGLLSRAQATAWAERPEEFAAKIREALVAVRPPQRAVEALEQVLRQLDQAALEKQFAPYPALHAEYAQASEIPFEPSHFEVAFGPVRAGDRQDALCLPDPWTLEHAGERLRLAGQVDRIDLAAVGEQQVFAIIDYKTGNVTAFTEEDFDEGLRLQLPLYAIAAEQHLLARQGAVAWQMGYWSMRKEKIVPFVLAEQVDGAIRPTAAWATGRGKLLSRVVSLVRGIRNGEFPMQNADQNCTSNCALRTVCRVGQARSLEKQWLPPTVEETS